MKIMFVMMMMIFSISMIIMLISSLISKKTFNDREKTSPFECGFDPKETPRKSFSINFFLIALIFLIFDVEIALILPIILTIPVSNLKIWLNSSIYFIIILIMGLYYEWKMGALNWL
uniref:NADH-ubiquinone oxidoreductase chain 3 n=1 Tax=Corynis lateralis TaxID=1983417 RepID=A0A1W6Q592_9HYME|nr:NADH dehydrogenase subunit 3 [Corynis lateralis]